MKGVIPTPDIAKNFHPTPDIKAKKCPTPTLKIHPDTRHPPSKRRKMQTTFPKWEPKSFVPLVQFLIWNSHYPTIFTPAAQNFSLTYFTLYVC